MSGSRAGAARAFPRIGLNGESTVSLEMILDAIDYVVLMKRRPNGPRYVADIQHVLGWHDHRYHLEPVTAEHLRNG